MAAAAIPGGPSQASRSSNARPYTPLGCVVIPPARHPVRFSPLPGTESRRCFLYGARYLPRAPLPETGVTRLRVVSTTTSEGITPPSSLLRAHAPHHNPLADFVFCLYLPVCAGCGEPLLEGGGSRRYLHNPCIGAWVRTPSRLPGAGTRFFPGNFGLTHGKRRSAREQSSLQCDFYRG